MVTRCEYCEKGKSLVVGKYDDPDNDDYGIAVVYPRRLLAYGYSVHGSGSNSITAYINYCPMCGKQL